MNTNSILGAIADEAPKYARRNKRPGLMLIRPLSAAFQELREQQQDYVADTPDKIVEYFRTDVITDERWSPEVENLIVVSLSVRRRIIGHFHVTTGLLDTTIAHPREVFRGAIMLNAAAVVLIHNHPSGDRTPSEADIKITRELIHAGRVIKIEVLDHIICTFDSYASMKAFGLMAV